MTDTLIKRIFLQIILLYSTTLFSQVNKNSYAFKNYDSLVVQTFNDYTYESDFDSNRRLDTIIITGQIAIFSEDAKSFSKRVKQKTSYGQNQAMTPVYDLKIMYFRKGKVKEEVRISLWTNNLYASFPLRVQRQGACMCGGNGGYCFTEGGISNDFKKYLITLLGKYHLPVIEEEL